MSRYLFDISKGRCFPLLLVAFLMLLHFLSGYPGGMTADSTDQFSQSLQFKFNSHHPPLMAMLWSIFHYIHTGPQVMLLLHLSLLWGGVLFLYYADDANKYRWMYFVIPFVPNILSESTMIWKDIGFGNSFFFTFTGCVYYLYKKEKAPWWIFIIFLLITFYGFAIKFQAKFILPILLFFIITVSSKHRLLYKILSTFILSAVFLGANSLIIAQFSIKSESWQMRVFFDMANIAKDINDDSLFPDHVRNSDIYSFEKLKKRTNHVLVNDLIFPEDRIYAPTQDKEKLRILENSFFKMICFHPISYIKHRLVNFMHLMLNYYSYNRYSAIDYKDELHDLGVNTTAITLFQKPFISFLKIYPKQLGRNFVSLLLVFIYIVTILKYYKSHSTETTILSYVVATALVFSISMLLATMANDYRYYYIVRLFSFFAIPIYLKLLSDYKKFL